MVIYSLLIIRMMEKTRNEKGEGFAIPGYWSAQAKWLREKFSGAAADLKLRLLPKVNVPGKI